MLVTSLLVSALAGYIADLVDRGIRRPPPERVGSNRPTSKAPNSAQGTEVAPLAAEPISEVVQNPARFLRTGGAVLGCVAISPFLPAAVLAVPGLVVIACMPFLRTGIAQWRKRGRPDDDALYFATMFIALLSQAFLALGIQLLVFWVRQCLYLATKDRSRRDIHELFGKPTGSAWLNIDGVETEVPIDRLQPGDTVIVPAGETIPVDGRVVGGTGRVDQRMLTGEEQLVELGNGDEAFAATQVLSGRLLIRVERAGAQTTAGRIVTLLNRTTDYRLSAEISAKRMVDAIAPYCLGLGAVMLPIIGLNRTAGLLSVIPGPWVLMISVPVGMLHTLSQAARRGIVIMDGRTLEMLPHVDTVVFDKTGTLTEAVPQLADIWCAERVAADDLLRWAASAEHRQQHPIARALLRAAQERGLAVSMPDDVDYVISNGVQARVDGRIVQVGSSRYMASLAVDIEAGARASEQAWHAMGRPVIHVACDGRHLGVISLRTSVRPEAKEVISALQASGLRVRILSGDGVAQTERVARELGVDGYDAEVLPHEKAEVIRRLRDEGRYVCFVGDGINDVVAMRQAQVSVAVANASAAATAVAGVIVYDDDLRHVCDLMELGRTFRQRTRDCIVASAVPGVIGAGAILFLGMGFISSILFSQVAMATGIIAIMRPWQRAIPRISQQPGGQDRQKQIPPPMRRLIGLTAAPRIRGQGSAAGQSVDGA